MTLTTVNAPTICPVNRCIIWMARVLERFIVIKMDYYVPPWSLDRAKCRTVKYSGRIVVIKRWPSTKYDSQFRPPSVRSSTQICTLRVKSRITKTNLCCRSNIGKRAWIVLSTYPPTPSSIPSATSAFTRRSLLILRRMCTISTTEDVPKKTSNVHLEENVQNVRTKSFS